jgi:hypothetical protein
MSIIDQAWLDANPGALTISRPKKPEYGRGYPCQPGTGPSGETCRSCANYAHNRGSEGRSKPYPKCWLMVKFWTNGPGTDIKAKSPACKYWVAKIGGKTFCQIDAEEQHERIMENLRSKSAATKGNKL